MPEVDDQEANRRHVNGGKVAGYKCLKMNSGSVQVSSILSPDSLLLVTLYVQY